MYVTSVCDCLHMVLQVSYPRRNVTTTTLAYTAETAFWGLMGTQTVSALKAEHQAGGKIGRLPRSTTTYCKQSFLDQLEVGYNPGSGNGNVC